MSKPKTIHTLESLKGKCIEEGDCWLWQGYMANNAAPMVYHNGELWFVRRLVATMIGKPPSPNHKYMSTKCGSKLCICPEHLQYRTEKQHMSAMAKAVDPRSITRKLNLMTAARKRSITKLSKEKVLAIHRDDRSYREIAADYGVSKSLVGKVKRGKAWEDIYKQINPFSGLGV